MTMPFAPGGRYQQLEAGRPAYVALGQGPEDSEHPPHWDPQAPPLRVWNRIPQFYRIAIELGGAAGDTQTGSVPIRPEPFVVKRITWAATGDTEAQSGVLTPLSQQGRSVEVRWADEFTRFLGEQSTLLSAMFGDSNGYLDLPGGILFQGRQTLSATLTRLFWPTTGAAIATTFHIQFQGLGLLPPNRG